MKLFDSFFPGSTTDDLYSFAKLRPSLSIVSINNSIKPNLEKLKVITDLELLQELEELDDKAVEAFFKKLPNTYSKVRIKNFFAKFEAPLLRLTKLTKQYMRLNIDLWGKQNLEPESSPQSKKRKRPNPNVFQFSPAEEEKKSVAPDSPVQSLISSFPEVMGRQAFQFFFPEITSDDTLNFINLIPSFRIITSSGFVQPDFYKLQYITPSELYQELIMLNNSCLAQRFKTLQNFSLIGFMELKPVNRFTELKRKFLEFLAKYEIQILKLTSLTKEYIEQELLPLPPTPASLSSTQHTLLGV